MDFSSFFLLSRSFVRATNNAAMLVDIYTGVRYILRSKGCRVNPAVSFRFEYALKHGINRWTN